MSIPRDLNLKRTRNGIRLVQKPSTVIESNLATLSGNQFLENSNLTIRNGELLIDARQEISGNSYWLEAELDVSPGAIAGFEIVGKKNKDNKIISGLVIGYDCSKHQLFVDKSYLSEGKVNKDKLIQKIEIENGENNIHLQILLDKSSVEIFVN